MSLFRVSHATVAGSGWHNVVAATGALAIHVALHHVTAYRYDRLVGLSPQLVRLRPAPHCRTPIVSYALRVTPPEHFLNWQQDPQSNYVARLTFPEKVHELRIEVDLVAEMSVYNPFDFFLEPYAEQSPFAYEDWQLQELQPYLRQEPLTPHFEAYLAGVSREPKRTIDFLVDLNRKVQGDIGYVIRLDPGVQTKEQTLELRSGSCRDSTWLLVQLMRHLGLAARFVSGYLIQLVPDVAALDGPKGAAQDFTDLHAWCEVYLPGAGWIGLDPTSGLLAGEGHIPLSCTPEPSSAAPVTGAVDECEVEFAHEMSVQRVYESPRVTKPYSDAQWDAIVAMGQRGRSRARGARRPVDDGRRADVRVGGRSRRRRMEHVGARADEAAARGRSAVAAAQALWRRRVRPLRSGQVVSGRAVAALGARLLLAARWRAVVARHVAVRGRASRLRLRRGRRGAFSARAGGSAWRHRSRTCRPASRTSSTTCGASAGCR